MSLADIAYKERMVKENSQNRKKMNIKKRERTIGRVKKVWVILFPFKFSKLCLVVEAKTITLLCFSVYLEEIFKTIIINWGW